MLFNSIDFAIFLPIVFLLYWVVSSFGVKYQNLVIVLVSYFFYGWWNWKFLSLILLSTTVDYFVGRQLDNQQNEVKRKILLWTSIIVNLGILGFFKYYNFFLENFVSAFSLFGTEIKAQSLNLILPIGISFYTFQTLSYTIDVYKKKIKSTNDFIAFSSFVCFFPQLVAGPIERAKHLLPQFYKKRKFNYTNAVNGLRQILWGLFKKIVIADNCAEFANQIFNESADYSGSTLALGAIFFAFQIYGDFSGYSDIAIGAARLFGINLSKNFAFPYFSRDIAEFWRRWHISLSSWFKDYLYIPLGGSKGSLHKTIRNVFLVFVISGFWHGANWTFIVWGMLNALYFLPLLMLKQNRKHLEIVANHRVFPTVREFLSILLTFGLTTLTWIFFRAESIPHALQFIKGLFENVESYFDLNIYWQYKTLIVLLLIFIFIEWKGRRENYAIEKIALNSNKTTRYLIYYIIILTIFWFGGKEHQFIYFQF